MHHLHVSTMLFCLQQFLVCFQVSCFDVSSLTFCSKSFGYPSNFMSPFEFQGDFFQFCKQFYQYFQRNCIQSVDCFRQYRHLNDAFLQYRLPIIVSMRSFISIPQFSLQRFSLIQINVSRSIFTIVNGISFLIFLSVTLLSILKTNFFMFIL